MANEVSNILKISFPIDMTDHVAEIIGKIQQEKNLHCVYDDFENTRDWYERRIGGKWAQLNDQCEVIEGEAYMNIGSAWSPIDPFVEHFNSLTDNKCTITHEFVDESPNFCGVRVWENGEVVYENVYDDLHSILEEEASKRSKGMTFEDDHEYFDWMWGWQWDYIHNLMDDPKTSTMTDTL